MRVKRFLLIFLITISVILAVSGCLKQPVKDRGPKKGVINSVEFQQPKPNKEYPAIIKQLKKYLRTAFLNLKIVNQKDYPSRVTTVFHKSLQDQASKDIETLSLGADGKKLDSVGKKNKLKIKSISLYSDQLKNNSLATVEFSFTSNYRANLKPVNLRVEGKMSLQKKGKGWKIFSYKLKQYLKSSR